MLANRSIYADYVENAIQSTLPIMGYSRSLKQTCQLDYEYIVAYMCTAVPYSLIITYMPKHLIGRNWLLKNFFARPNQVSYEYWENFKNCMLNIKEE